VRPEGKGGIVVRGMASWLSAAGRAGGLALAIALALAPSVAYGIGPAVVTGSFAYRDGSPAKDRQLHFENRASRDIYVVGTGSDGTFSVDLPQGVYDLRAERGLVLISGIVVAKSDLNVGKAVEGAPLDVRRPFDYEGVAAAIVTSPAPATAHVTGRPVATTQ